VINSRGIRFDTLDMRNSGHPGAAMVSLKEVLLGRQRRSSRDKECNTNDANEQSEESSSSSKGGLLV
jgi:hypothetical protein